MGSYYIKEKMKIAIDISQIVYETGVSWYTKKLIENLLKIDRENEYILFGGSLRRLDDLRAKTNHFSGNFTTKFFPIAPTVSDFVWNKLHLISIERLIGEVDVFHSSDWSQPPTKAFKVTTVHDLWPIKYPDKTHPRIAATHRARLYWVKKEVDRIIVPSEATKTDLIELGIEKERIKVIYEGPHIEKKFEDKAFIEDIKKQLKISGDYILGVGVNERKNTKNIIKAFELSKAGKDLTLVLVGRPQIKLEHQRGVRLVGAVSDKVMEALYAGAQALVFPSLYEGFGLPILDAFVSECPVVTSNLSSMKEIAGAGAVLVDPNDINSISDGIKYAVTHRQTLIKKGLQRVKAFSWQRAAEETLQVYKK